MQGVVKRKHGIVSLLLAAVAIGIAVVAAFRESVGLGIGYGVLCAVSGQVVVYAYCAKCPCKATCGHVLPGRAAQRYHRQPAPYTQRELAALAGALLLMIGLPHGWLWRSPALLVLYWLFMGIGLVEVRSFVCRACGNTFCPLNAAFGEAADS